MGVGIFSSTPRLSLSIRDSLHSDGRWGSVVSLGDGHNVAGNNDSAATRNLRARNHRSAASGGARARGSPAGGVEGGAVAGWVTQIDGRMGGLLGNHEARMGAQARAVPRPVAAGRARVRFIPREAIRSSASVQAANPEREANENIGIPAAAAEAIGGSDSTSSSAAFSTISSWFGRVYSSVGVRGALSSSGVLGWASGLLGWASELLGWASGMLGRASEALG